jgi:capsular polysaccharide biosynthesis protein
MKASLTRVEIAAVLLAAFAVINLIASVIGIAAGPRTYEARIELLVGAGPSADEQNFQDPRLLAGIAELYAVLATSKPVLEQVIQALDLDASATDLAARVRVETVIGSPFFAVSASDPDRTLAASIANEIGAVLAATNHEASASPHALQIVESAIPPVDSADSLRLISAGVAGVLALLIFTALIALPRDGAATRA